jgi:myo-inositol-1(or 4)-monophosphatase
MSTPQAGLDKRFELAQTIAPRAGDILLGWQGRLKQVERKGAVDLVTAADRASEAFIVAALTEQFPNDAVLAEEGGGHSGTSGFEWIVDPLDGTTNFVHGHPFYMVSIGLRFEGARVAGVCFGPVLKQLFGARIGAGASLNGAPTRVSSTAALADSLLATGFPYNRRDMLDELLAPVGRALAEAQGVRRGGSACYDLCMTACGQIDGFFERGLHAWDLCAATLIVEEAGGQLSGYDGEFELFSDTVIASNGHIHTELRERVVRGD